MESRSPSRRPNHGHSTDHNDHRRVDAALSVAAVQPDDPVAGSRVAVDRRLPWSISLAPDTTYASVAIMRRPETRYVKNGDAYIAYQIVGDGSTDLVVLTQWFSHVDGQWDLPPLAAFLERLASFSRVISFDKRGTGLSDPVTVSLLPSIEDWMDDLRVVLDETGVERAAIVANLGSAFMAAVFAATYPDRVTALVLVNAYARFTRSPDYPWGFAAEERARCARPTARRMGQGHAG